MTVLAQLLERLTHAHRDAITHSPGVRIVAVLAPPHAPCGPSDNPHPGPIDRGSGGEGMHESHVAVGERSAHISFRNILAEINPQIERALGLQWRLLLTDTVRHSALPAASHPPWKVRLITSVCCSRVSRTKLTA